MQTQNKEIEFQYWGLIDYEEALAKQEKLFSQAVSSKLAGREHQDIFAICQHPNVYTLGRHGKEENMLLTAEQLQSVGARLYHISRGGDITYHGPGQIVVYPILDLEHLGIGLKEYIHRLEEIIIRVVARYGLSAERITGATGVWLREPDRKICAIGVKASHYVTMHGLALNVNTELQYFSYINPCGFTDKGVTSLQKELNRAVDIEQVIRYIEIEARNLLLTNQ